MGGRDSILGEARKQEQEQDEEPEPEPEIEEESETTSGPDRDQNETTEKNKKPERKEFSQRMPPELVDRVDAYAETNHFPSRNFTINHMIEGYLAEIADESEYEVED